MLRGGVESIKGCPAVTLAPKASRPLFPGGLGSAAVRLRLRELLAAARPASPEWTPPIMDSIIHMYTRHRGHRRRPACESPPPLTY